MEAFRIPYQETNRFSKLVVDYLNKCSKLEPFINHFPSLDNFEKQIKQKALHNIDRVTLVEVLENQNSIISLSDISSSNIQSLKYDNTFTITTGHQLCLFTGPLYFIYKILSTINLTEQLKRKYPDQNFVPVFWMATEDHDLQEINHINLFGKKLEWQSQHSGAVGRMSLHGIKIVIDELKSIFSETDNLQRLLSLFEDSYLNHQNLSDATRYLVNELFGKYGLLIIDGDDKKLKQQFIPQIKKDILEHGFVKTIKESSKRLADSYISQAFVRDINFFKLSDKDRLLITEKGEAKDIDTNPEYFSPNVLLRPLYQESVLPNIAIIGGGSEIAYWLQLKDVFQQENVPFPILVLRNSAILISDQQMKKIKGFGFDLNDIFKDTHALQKQYVLFEGSSETSLSDEKSAIKKLYSLILEKISDKGLINNVKAELQKQINVLNTLELKIIRLEKQKHQAAINQISKLKQQLFPDNSLQERYDNFIPFYLKYGENFIKILKQNLNPLEPNFVVLSY